VKLRADGKGTLQVKSGGLGYYVLYLEASGVELVKGDQVLVEARISMENLKRAQDREVEVECEHLSVQVEGKL